MKNQNFQDYYSGKKVLVTGGLGFIGSNLSLTLGRLGASVVIVDSLVPGCGGALQNIAGAEGDVCCIHADIKDQEALEPYIREAKVIFNLAGEIAHLSSIWNADRDLALNVSSQLAFLDSCVKFNPAARIVYTSTRQVYGVPGYLPVDEAHPLMPVDFNGIHKLAAAQYHLLLWKIKQLDTAVLYLTNVYGPRMALHLPHQGVLATFLRQAIAGHQIRVFGDGQQQRDPLYVDDAVEAILRTGVATLGVNRSLNIGHPEVWSVHEIARQISQVTDLPHPVLCAFPPDRQLIDIGSYYTDIRLSESVLGWRATTSLSQGIAQSLSFFGGQTLTHLEQLAKPNQEQLV